MSIFNGLSSIVEADYPLAKHTWYAIGGPADYFVRPQTVEELQEVMIRCRDNDIRTYVVGLGSNLLIPDEGVRGAVIKLEADHFRQTHFDGDTVTVWAGAELRRLILTSVKKGFSGIEILSGIPGSIGGAVRMNAGGHFGDIGTVVESVTLMDKQGKIFEKRKPELSFDYRSTNITAPLILNAKLNLKSADPEQILRTVQECWILKKNTQPLNSRNCGCIFKNPRGHSAGALVDRAGLKGLRIGGAKVSEKHGNFIEADRGCQSADVLKLIDAVRERVREQFNIEMNLEIQVWK